MAVFQSSNKTINDYLNEPINVWKILTINIIKRLESKLFLQSQLALISPYSSASSNIVLDDRTRLKILHVEYSNLLSRYSPTHPDVVKIKTEIEALSGQGSNAGNRQALTIALKEKKAALAKIKGKLFSSTS